MIQSSSNRTANSYRPFSPKSLSRRIMQKLWGLTKRKPDDMPVIDGLRGISILMIVLFHSFYGVLFVLRGFNPVLEFLNKIPTYLMFIAGADKAVDIFFVVSAFLVGNSLLKKFESVNYLSKNDIILFYLKRIIRIYPLFILGILLYANVNWKQSLKNLPYNLLFIDNFDFRCIIPVGWSLSIEMQFYALLPWLLKLLFKFSAKVQLILLASFFVSSSLISLAVCLIYPEIYQNHFYNFHPDFIHPQTMMDRLYYPTHTRFGPLMLGLIWAKIENHLTLKTKITSFLKRHNFLPNFFVILGFFTMFLTMNFPVYKPQSYYYEHFSPTLNLILHSTHRNLFCFGLMLILMPIFYSESPTRLIRGIKHFLSLRALRPFSQVVFPIYLFHFPMIAIAGLLVFQTTKIHLITNITLLHVFKIFALASFLSLLLGIFLHFCLESPLMRRGYHWAHERTKNNQNI